MRDELNNVNPASAEVEDPMLQSALNDFRASVHAWSDAASNRTRLAVSPASRFAWRRSVAWVLSLLLSFGILGAAAYQHHHHDVLARQAQQRETERQQALAAAQHARETEELMGNIDTDVSREVPAAMDPLAALMTDDTQ
jgi:predicted outer membrane lipoprotein